MGKFAPGGTSLQQELLGYGREELCRLLLRYDSVQYFERQMTSKYSSALWLAPFLWGAGSNCGLSLLSGARSREQIVSRRDTATVACASTLPVAFPGTKALPFSKLRSGSQGIFALSVSVCHLDWQTLLATESHRTVHPIERARLTGLVLLIRFVTLTMPFGEGLDLKTWNEKTSVDFSRPVISLPDPRTLFSL
jgi:hypothetical protein